MEKDSPTTCSSVRQACFGHCPAPRRSPQRSLGSEKVCNSKRKYLINQVRSKRFQPESCFASDWHPACLGESGAVAPRAAREPVSLLSGRVPPRWSVFPTARPADGSRRHSLRRLGFLAPRGPDALTELQETVLWAAFPPQGTGLWRRLLPFCPGGQVWEEAAGEATRGGKADLSSRKAGGRPDRKGHSALPELQVLAEPEPCLPRGLRPCQRPGPVQTNISLVSLIHCCSARQTAGRRELLPPQRVAGPPLQTGSLSQGGRGQGLRPGLGPLPLQEERQPPGAHRATCFTLLSFCFLIRKLGLVSTGETEEVELWNASSSPWTP